MFEWSDPKFRISKISWHKCTTKSDQYKIDQLGYKVSTDKYANKIHVGIKECYEKAPEGEWCKNCDEGNTLPNN